jgi:hypothetical protein
MGPRTTTSSTRSLARQGSQTRPWLRIDASSPELGPGPAPAIEVQGVEVLSASAGAVTVALPLRPGFTLWIGRRASSDPSQPYVRIAHATVTKKHAALACDGERYTLLNVPTHGGLLLRGNLLRGDHVLTAGDEVQFAGGIRLRYGEGDVSGA